MTAAGFQPSCLNLSAHVDHRFGGLTTSLPEYCEALRQTGRYRAPLAAFCNPGEAAEGTVDTTLLPAGRLRWTFSAALHRNFRSIVANADVIHIHGLWQQQTALGSSEASAARKPYMISAHGMLEPWAFHNKAWKKRLYWRFLESAYLKGAHCLRALTAAEAGHYRALGLRMPIAVIPNGVTVPPVISEEPFFRRFPALQGKRLVLFLGRLHPKKGIEMLLKEWFSVCMARPDAHLVIAGPDTDGYRLVLEQLAAECGIQSCVTFTGMLRGQEKWAALRASAYFTLPSFSEGFSVSVLEALAAGTPVILTRQCYFPEVDDYKCGWTIDAEPAELAAALTEALGTAPETRAVLGERARRLVQDRFTWAAVGAQSAGVFDWILGGGAPPSVVDIPR